MEGECFCDFDVWYRKGPEECGRVLYVEARRLCPLHEETAKSKGWSAVFSGWGIWDAGASASPRIAVQLRFCGSEGYSRAQRAFDIQELGTG